MKQSALLLGSLLALAACATTPATPPVSDATVQAHVDAATRLAGDDLKPFLALCKPAPATRPTVDAADLAAQIAKPSPPPGKAFDNLYWVGDSWVSAWAINTSDGIILLDTLNEGKEAARLIEGGLRRVGLNPARIKYIIVTHGHGDHYGGVNYLVSRYHPHVAMGEADWKMMETKLDFPTPIWEPIPKRDIEVKDGDKITLGDTTVTMYITAGHTMGTISPVFDVTSPGEHHRVMEWGGTGFNFGKDFGRLDAFIASTKRMRTVAAEQNVDVLISNHPNFDEAPAKLARLRSVPRGPNPFVQGTANVQRALDVMNECGLAQHDRFTMTN
jgi:metallo-beta-lactamase class B